MKNLGCENISEIDPYKDAYFIAGKVIMHILFGEKVERAEIKEFDLHNLLAVNCGEKTRATGNVNNINDTQNFEQTTGGYGRRLTERLFLIVTGGIWAQSVFLYRNDHRFSNQNNLSDYLEAIESIAIDLYPDKLSTLRCLVEELQFDSIDDGNKSITNAFLDYEAFLYRHSYAIITQKYVWNAVEDIARRLAEKRILSGKEIYHGYTDSKEINNLKREITEFHSLS